MREAKIKNIFARPVLGWTEWNVSGHKVGPISYMSNVPEIVILSCIRYLNSKDEDFANAPFHILFDAEGYFTGLVMMGDRDFFSYSTKKEGPNYIEDLTLLSKDMYGKEFIWHFLAGAVEDFKSNFDEWADFMSVTGEAEDVEKSKKYLEIMLESAKCVLEREEGKW